MKPKRRLTFRNFSPRPAAPAREKLSISGSIPSLLARLPTNHFSRSAKKNWPAASDIGSCCPRFENAGGIRPVSLKHIENQQHQTFLAGNARVLGNPHPFRG